MRFNNTDSKITLGEIFLNPTRIYCDPIVDLIHHAKTDEAGFTIADLRAICHVTGGGYPTYFGYMILLVGILIRLYRFIQNLIGCKKLVAWRQRNVSHLQHGNWNNYRSQQNS